MLLWRFNSLEPLAINVFAKFSKRSGPVAMLSDENPEYGNFLNVGFLVVVDTVELA